MTVAASSWTTAVLALYYLILGVLAFYGVHRLILVVLWWRGRRRATPVPPDPADWPTVTVQLPLYNEMYVAERLIDAVAALDYPHDRLEIQVLDDSTDETTATVAQAVERWRAAGLDIHLLHRTDRTGFKAGALAEGLKVAKGEFLAVFDADFVPTPDFLRRTVPHFADPALGLVQGRWTHLNSSFSLLTRIQGMLLDGHFLIEHFARNRSGCFFNFNGTAGIWRRQAIADGGGWTHDTLTEDLDLSYRSQLAGWKFLFLPDLAVPSELPVDVNGFKNQQHRWAKGSVQTGRKLLPRLLTQRGLPLKVRFEAFVHLTNNLSYLLMVALSLLVFPAMLLRRGASLGEVLLFDLPIFLGATLSVLVFYLAAQVAGGAGWKQQLRYLPALMGLGIGLSVNNARAVASGLVSSGGTFVRTPKYRIEAGRGDWLRLRYRAGKNYSVLLEGALALYFAVVTGLAIYWQMWAALPFLYLFLQGYSYMFLLSVLPGLGRSSTPEPVGGS
jgi:cellulose synthase/poly-beta-1,6-N-acetylglucosamine synthase-like glycosyltransferase